MKMSLKKKSSQRHFSICRIFFRLMVDHCDCGLSNWLGQQEFSIPQNVLDIVYAQTIGWWVTILPYYGPYHKSEVELKSNSS